jgi:polysaccharide deacetylase family protein (PEP-CTERM system associated)
MNVLTFDIEDWFHLLDHPATSTESEWQKFPARVEENTERLLQLLSDTASRATFFCLGWIAKRHPQLIRRIHEQGYEVASHSFAHRLAYEQSRAQFSEDLRRVVGTLENITGAKVRAHRAPGFSFTANNTWVFDVMAAQGIVYDSSIFAANRAHGGFPALDLSTPAVIEVGGCEIREFPINLASFLGQRIVFSGGGYFRLLPSALIHRLMRRSQYVMTYFHPRDFDVDQPLVPGLSPARRFRSYYGIKGGLSKLRLLIETFPVLDLSQAAEQVNWSTCRRIKL